MNPDISVLGQQIYDRACSKGLRYASILSYFDQRQNYLYIDGNLKIMLYKVKKNTKEIIINHKGTRMVKDGEDYHGLQTRKLTKLG